jgi:hypothetical protein
MSSSNEPPGGPAGQRGRRRPPTIDLKATEVAGEPAKAADTTSAPDPGPAAPPVQPTPAREAGAKPVRERQAERPHPEQPTERAAAASASASEPPRKHPAIAWLPPDFPWPLVAAGAGGAVLTLTVLALVGVFSSRDDGVLAVDTRLARVEEQLRDLAAKPLPAASDPKAVDDLAGRLARLETVAATPRPVTDPALANRIAALEGDLKALGERVGVLGRRNDEIAASVRELKNAPAAPVIPRAEIEALTGRIAALERAAKAIEAQLGARAAGEGAFDRSLRLLVVANALNAAVERGAPFITELAAAKAAASDPKLLAALEPFAKSGVPGTNALARELTELAPALAKAVGTAPREGGILDRLRANAEKIVQVRRIDEAPGDDPVAIVRRIERRAGEGNVAGAIAEIAKLPEPARALTKEWVAKVEARNAAVEASQRFAAAALASIAKPSP